MLLIVHLIQELVTFLGRLVFRPYPGHVSRAVEISPVNDEWFHLLRTLLFPILQLTVVIIFGAKGVD